MTIGSSMRLLLRNPRQFLASRLQHAPFYLQSQMDIHPKSRWRNPDFIELTNGLLPRRSSEGIERRTLDLEPWDNVRRDMIVLLLRTVEDATVPGEFAEVGVYKGLTARLIHHYAPERTLHLFDTFAGFTDRGKRRELETTRIRVSASQFSDTSRDAVEALIDPANDNVVFHEGYFPDSIPERLASARFAFVHLDADLYEPIMAGLGFFYPRISPRGMILVHDYNAWPGARRAVDEFLEGKDEVAIPMPDKSGSALIVRSGRNV